MVEVFKTNVTDQEQANRILAVIHKIFLDCQANFDLEDCDKILRIKSTAAIIRPASMIDFLQASGIKAEVLTDEICEPDTLQPKPINR